MRRCRSLRQGRASLAAAGFAGRSAVLLGDYCCARLPHAEGPTLFLGNPPYVRHHQIAAPGKDWLRRAAREQGLPASGLAGLHALTGAGSSAALRLAA